jgi:hypothetical protein
MVPDRQSWPDVDGSPVALGDWVQVFCTWTHQPKFDGRPVQIVEVLQGERGAVFRLLDPDERVTSKQFLTADGHSYRRVSAPN